MNDLHENSSFLEISDYAALCREFGIVTVRLKKPVYDRVKMVLRPLVGEQAFAGVKFKRKNAHYDYHNL